MKQIGEYDFGTPVLPCILILCPEKTYRQSRQCGAVLGFCPKAGRKKPKFKHPEAVKLKYTRGRVRKRTKLYSSFSQTHQVESLFLREMKYGERNWTVTLREVPPHGTKRPEIQRFPPNRDVCFIIPT